MKCGKDDGRDRDHPRGVNAPFGDGGVGKTAEGDFFHDGCANGNQQCENNERDEGPGRSDVTSNLTCGRVELTDDSGNEESNGARPEECYDPSEEPPASVAPGEVNPQVNDRPIATKLGDEQWPTSQRDPRRDEADEQTPGQRQIEDAFD